MHFLFDFEQLPDRRRADQQRPAQSGPDHAVRREQRRRQYNIVDDVRNDAYGVYGQYQNFVNTLNLRHVDLRRERRPGNAPRHARASACTGKTATSARRTLDWQADRYNRLKIGGEFTQYKHRELLASRWPASSSTTPTRKADPVERLRRGSARPRRRGGGRRPSVRLLRQPRQPAVRDRHRWATPTRSRASSSMPGFDPERIPPRSSCGQEPQLSEPAHPGVVPGDRPDQLPAVVLAPGADAGLRAALRRHQRGPVNNTNTNQVYGTDLDFGKTITFEFGIRHAFSDDMVLDVAAYNKDIVSDPAARLVALYRPGRLGRDNDFRILTNLDFGNVRGLDVRLDRRFGNYFNGTRLLLVPAGQEHGLRSVHVHELRLAHREPGRRQQRRAAAAAGHPADRQQPAAHPGQRLLHQPAG